VKHRILLLTAWICAGAPLARAQQANAPAAAPTRYNDKVDMMSVLKRVLTPQGLVDKEYARAVAKPNPYLGHFYGVQAIRDVSKDVIKKSFVPAYAKTLKEDDNALELRFSERGFTARFVANSTLDLGMAKSPRSHVYISGDTWKEMLSNVDAFLDAVRALNQQDTFFIPNPKFEEEKAVAKRLATGGPRVEIQVDPRLAAWRKSKQDIVIYPDAVHGDEAGFQNFLAFLKAAEADWIALEALTQELQKDADSYVQAPVDSDEFARARKKLSETFAAGWDKRFKDQSEPHFMKVLDHARRRKTRVIGLEKEAGLLDQIIWNNGEGFFGGACRSYGWAKALPANGKGVVFGGSAHFTSDAPVNFQDFVKDLRKEIAFHSPTPFGPFGIK
jgi:hypothetical protein